MQRPETTISLASNREDGLPLKALVFTVALTLDLLMYFLLLQKVVTRVNSMNGIAYKNDPTIFAWELINEPRCQTDISGRTLKVKQHINIAVT